MMKIRRELRNRKGEVWCQCLFYPDEKILKFKWVGSIQLLPIEISIAREFTLRLLKEFQPSYVLNDASLFNSGWYYDRERSEQVWLPTLNSIGIKKIAYVFSSHPFGTKEAKEMQEVARKRFQHPDIQLFPNIQQAKDWLLTHINL
ncbi:hypothetical protein V6R21_03640 [Limibacter armeniacum]|uniref:hypothetical protein n=1 Tax=Limibacter armeniacum TaxID=466084 RepID=UPI002FE63A77